MAGEVPPTIHTFSGVMIAPLAVDPRHVRIIDIAEQLGKQARFSGATGSGGGVREKVEVEVAPGWVRTIPPGKFYSVAQHAVLASRNVEPEFAWDALHHDNAEYVLQDVVRPLKADERFGQPYRGAEKRVEAVLGPLLDVRFPMPPEVKVADERMLVTEAEQLMHGRDDAAWDFFKGVEPYDITITPWSPQRAAAKWLERFFVLADARGFDYSVTPDLMYGLEEVA